MKRKFFKFFLVTLIFVVVISITFRTLPIEFEDKVFGRDICEFCFYAILFNTLLLSLVFVINDEDKLPRLILKTCISFFVIIPVYIILVIICFAASPQDWTREKKLFINKVDDSKKIVERFYSSGLMDNTETSSSIIEKEKIGKLFVWIKVVDTNKLNKNEWIRFDNQ